MVGISFVKRFRPKARRPRTSVSMCGPHFCSMKIAEDVRKFAAEQGINEKDAIEEGLPEKAKEFVEKGAEIYANG